jgi:hypothetical protein
MYLDANNNRRQCKIEKFLEPDPPMDDQDEENHEDYPADDD